MEFLLDESADFPLAKALTDLSHDVTAIAHDYPYALKDTEVLAIAQREERVLITKDRDFGELIFRRRLPHFGVILFRLHLEDVQTKFIWLDYVITNHTAELKQFIVITPRGIRIRRAD